MRGTLGFGESLIKIVRQKAIRSVAKTLYMLATIMSQAERVRYVMQIGECVRIRAGSGTARKSRGGIHSVASELRSGISRMLESLSDALAKEELQPKLL